MPRSVHLPYTLLGLKKSKELMQRMKPEGFPTLRAVVTVGGPDLAGTLTPFQRAGKSSHSACLCLGMIFPSSRGQCRE